MTDPYDYTGRDGRGNDKLWHEEDEDMEFEAQVELMLERGAADREMAIAWINGGETEDESVDTDYDPYREADLMWAHDMSPYDDKFELED